VRFGEPSNSPILIWSRTGTTRWRKNIMLEGLTVVAVTSPGYRDTIYVGVVRVVDSDWIVLNPAVSVLHYSKIGVAGIARDPTGADRLRGCGRRVFVPRGPLSVLLEADAALWAPVLEAHNGTA
jgi:hypothetical protein